MAPEGISRDCVKAARRSLTFATKPPREAVSALIRRRMRREREGDKETGDFEVGRRSGSAQGFDGDAMAERIKPLPVKLVLPMMACRHAAHCAGLLSRPVSLRAGNHRSTHLTSCLLYTSDAADD